MVILPVFIWFSVGLFLDTDIALRHEYRQESYLCMEKTIRSYE